MSIVMLPNRVKIHRWALACLLLLSRLYLMHPEKLLQRSIELPTGAWRCLRQPQHRPMMHHFFGRKFDGLDLRTPDFTSLERSCPLPASRLVPDLGAASPPSLVCM